MPSYDVDVRCLPSLPFSVQRIVCLGGMPRAAQARIPPPQEGRRRDRARPHGTVADALHHDWRIPTGNPGATQRTSAALEDILLPATSHQHPSCIDDLPTYQAAWFCVRSPVLPLNPDLPPQISLSSKKTLHLMEEAKCSQTSHTVGRPCFPNY